MTAEAVVMNKSAVALAADSAVTISSGRAGFKTYDTVNKLFELIRGSNIGVMIYANAEINAVPWETVIKSYRAEHAAFCAPHVEDYFEHFTKFLSGNTEILRPDDEYFTVVDAAYSRLLPLFRYIEDRIDYWVTASTGRVVKARLQEVVTDGLDAWEEAVKDATSTPWADELEVTDLQRLYAGRVDNLINELFESFRLPVSLKRRIRTLCLEDLRRCISEPGESGLVMTGFGTKDYFPKLIETMIRGRLNGVLRSVHTEALQVNLENPGHIRTFAQDEQAWGWLSGITQETRQTIVSHWHHWVELGTKNAASRAVLKQAVPKLTDGQLTKLLNAFSDMTEKRLSQFIEDMNQIEMSLYIQPMLQSVAALPKDELGVLAESLVNVTSMRQRVSIFDANTVGGAIDVALISHGDGFVWLNRKHYFPPELNPAWHLTRTANINI